MSVNRSLPATLRAWLTSPEAELTRWRRTVISAAALALHCARQLRRDRAPQMAAALAYRTIFGLIPSLVLSLIVLRFFSTDSIGATLRRVLDYTGLSELTLPASGTAQGAGAQPVSAWIEQLVARVSGLNFAAIGVVGVLVLLYAALSLMAQVEQSFNTVYKAASGRSIVARLTQYWTILTLGPLGVFASFWIGDRSTAALTQLGVGGALPALGILPAFAVSWLLLLLAYSMIPHTRVRLRPALTGAFVGAFLWELGKWGFGEYLGFATGYSRFYGSLGLLPVFLLWVYLTWLIVLFGLELSYAAQTLDLGLASLRGLDAREEPAVEVSVAIATLAAVGEAFTQGKPVSAPAVARALDVTPEHTRRTLAALERAGLLHQVERPDDEPAAWALSMPPDQIDLAIVAGSLAPIEAGASAAAQRGARLVHESLARGLRGRTLASLLAPAAPADSNTAQSGAG